MNWLLDTNVVSETVRAQPNGAVSAWISAQTSGSLAVSIVTLAELRLGLATTTDRDLYNRLALWLDNFIPHWFEDRILLLDVPILTQWLATGRRLAREGKTRDPTDLLIAATARHHGLAIATRNTRHFIGTGVTVYNPWTDETHHTS